MPPANIAESRHSTPQAIPPTQSTVSYNLGHIGAGNAIAAAASQAIAATQQVSENFGPVLHVNLLIAPK